MIASDILELPLLAGLEPPTTARLAPAFTRRTFAPGELISIPGATLSLASGIVRVARLAADGRSVGCGLIPEGGLFGALPFGAGMPDERAEALGDVRVVAIARADIERVAAASPIVACNVSALLAARLAETERQLAALALTSVPARLAATLLELADGHGRMTPTGVRIDVCLTHGQLAEMTSTTRETLTKTAGWLRNEGIVTLARREVRLNDLDALGEVAEGRRLMPGRGDRARVIA